MRMKRVIGSVLSLALCLFAATSGKAELVSIPLINPGAETGDMTGWTGSDFMAKGTGSHHSGNYHFEVEPWLADDMLHGVWLRMEQHVDLSAWAGRIEDIKVHGWARHDQAQAYGVKDGDYYEYQLEAYVGYDFYDINGDRIHGLNRLTEADGWQEITMNSTWYSNWNNVKGDIYSIEVEFGYVLSSWGSPPIGELDWADWDFLPPENMAFDDVRLELEVNPVPLPSAILLLGSGLTALCFRRKKK